MKYYLTLPLIFAGLSVYAQQTLAEHHFESADIDEVVVMGSFCDVYVSKGAKVTFDGVIEGKGDKDDYLIASIKSGKSVVFKVERKVQNGWNWDNITKATFEITIPDGTYLKLDNTSGDVQVRGLTAREYKIETTSGDITIDELKGKLEGMSTSGDVRITGVSGNINFKTTSGDQKFGDIIGNLDTRSTSGDITARAVSGSVFIRSTSGDLEFAQVDGALSLESTSGDIQGTRVRLTADSEARSTSGDIYIEFANDLDEIGFDLRASSGDLKVGSIRAEDELLLRRGKFLFRGVSSSGDQTYVD